VLLTSPRTPYCTLAVTLAFAEGENVQLRRRLPPLEQAPDQTACRPLDTLSTMVVPAANDAEAVLPTATLIPSGLDVMRSPVRPVAVTVTTWVPDGAAVTVSDALRLAPPYVPVMVALDVAASEDDVSTGNVALVPPGETVTVAGTTATAGFELASGTSAPEAGAAADSVTRPTEELPAGTEAGVTLTADSDAAGGGGLLLPGVTERITVRDTPP
jgi:hypothetical protein